jgi:Flp pilus assembly protein TadB
VSALERPTPPAGEEIHLPGPSLQPLLICVGVTIALLGVTLSVLLVILGALIFLVTLVLWVRDARRELEHLPLDHPH